MSRCVDRISNSSLSRKALANCFALLFVFISVPSLVLTPPFQVADSFQHFDRSVGISFGQFIGSTEGDKSGGRLPSGVDIFSNYFNALPFNSAYKVTKNEFVEANKQSWSSQKVFTPFPATTLHNPVAYLPEASAILLSRIFSNRIIVSYYFSELINLSVFLLIIWWCLRRVPVAVGAILSVLAFLPMIVSMANSPNPDGIYFALSVLAATCVYLEYFENSGRLQNQKNTNRRSYSPLFMTRNSFVGWCSVAILASEKPPYILLGLLIPMSYLSQQQYKKYFSQVGVCISAIVVLTLLWFRFGARSVGAIPPVDGINPTKQVHFLLANPLSIVWTPIHTLLAGWSSYWKEGIGVLGWLDTPLPQWFYVTATAVVVLLFMILVRNSKMRMVPLAIYLFATTIGLSLICLTLFVDSTVVGYPVALGVQGRYFLEFVPALVVTIGLVQKEDQKFHMMSLVGIISFGLLSESVLTMSLVNRFWLS